jgi:hypothetical protein
MDEFAFWCDPPIAKSKLVSLAPGRGGQEEGDRMHANSSSCSFSKASSLLCRLQWPITKGQYTASGCGYSRQMGPGAGFLSEVDFNF